MSKSVGDIGDEIHILTLLSSEQTIDGINYNLDDVDVLPLVESSDVVCLCHLALMEDDVDGAGVIHYIQPVAHILSLAIYRQWFAMADIVDEQRDELLGELIWTVVVRAVGHDCRHTICVVEGTHEVVAARL